MPNAAAASPPSANPAQSCGPTEVVPRRSDHLTSSGKAGTSARPGPSATGIRRSGSFVHVHADTHAWSAIRYPHCGPFVVSPSGALWVGTTVGSGQRKPRRTRRFGMANWPVQRAPSGRRQPVRNVLVSTDAPPHRVSRPTHTADHEPRIAPSPLGKSARCSTVQPISPHTERRCRESSVHRSEHAGRCADCIDPGAPSQRSWGLRATL